MNTNDISIRPETVAAAAAAEDPLLGTKMGTTEVLISRLGPRIRQNVSQPFIMYIYFGLCQSWPSHFSSSGRNRTCSLSLDEVLFGRLNNGAYVTMNRVTRRRLKRQTNRTLPF